MWGAISSVLFSLRPIQDVFEEAERIVKWLIDSLPKCLSDSECNDSPTTCIADQKYSTRIY